MGPQMQKYLWWKKYLTIMQIVSDLYFISVFIFLLLFALSNSKMNEYYAVSTQYNVSVTNTKLYQLCVHACQHTLHLHLRLSVVDFFFV